MLNSKTAGSPAGQGKLSLDRNINILVPYIVPIYDMPRVALI